MSLFRQKSIDRINSPEQLNDYIRVATPSVWLVLAALVLLLIGMLACWRGVRWAWWRLSARTEARNWYTR